MRPPIKINAKGRNQSTKVSTMASGGINLRELPQLLDVNVAQDINNYLITAEGQLYTRQGYTNYLSVANTSPMTSITKYTDDLYVYTYSNILAIYRISTGIHTIVKSDFINTRFSVVKYGDYVYVANGRDGTNMQRISQTLNFDNQTINFTIGNIVIGGTSGAKGKILEMTDAGATGTLTLGNISGTFIDNETLSDGTGNGLVNGTLSFTIQDNINAPKCEVLTEYDRRLYAGNTNNDISEYYYCKSDDQTNPPFTNWTTGTLATSANKGTFRNLGALKTFGFQDGKIVCFHERGKYAFTIDQIDVAGTISQRVITAWQYVDHGGVSCISTPWGIFYTSQGKGIYQLLSGGQTLNQSQVANSLNEEKISKVLGDDYFEDIDLTNSNFVYDQKRQNIMLTCAKNSIVNNLILVYNIPNKTFTRITGWNINRFMVDGDLLFGASAIKTNLFKLFDGFTDDGNIIPTIFLQEIKTDLVTLKSLEDFIIQSNLSYSSDITITLDYYNWRGDLSDNKKVLKLSVNRTANVGDVDMYTGLGSTYMGGAFGYYGESVNLYSSIAQLKPRIPELWRLRIRITANDKVPHVINFFTCRFEQKDKQLRLNNLVDANKPVERNIVQYVVDQNKGYESLENLYADLVSYFPCYNNIIPNTNAIGNTTMILSKYYIVVPPNTRIANIISVININTPDPTKVISPSSNFYYYVPINIGGTYYLKEYVFLDYVTLPIQALVVLKKDGTECIRVFKWN